MGGLIGFNSGTVENSYARGAVDGFEENAGALVGKNGESSDSGTIRRSYATAGSSRGPTIPGPRLPNPISVRGSFTTGGLVGNNSAGTVTDSYWDVNTTGLDAFDDGIGLTTAEMTGSAARGNMTGFDFTTTWETVTNPDDYPILAWQTEDGGDTAPANFDVTIDSTNSPVTEGDTLQITVTATNTGGQQDTQTITAMGSGLGPITRPVTLDGGESTTETVSIPTSVGDAGTFTVTVESDDDTATKTVTVEQDTVGSVVDNYRNSNGNVDTGGLQQAINDLLQQNISTGDLQAVIQAFITS